MIYLAADHRGFELKEKIKSWLLEWNLEFEDLGNDQPDPEDDYPDFARKVAEKLGEIGDKGIVVCGSGVGMDICVNRFPKARCGLGYALGQTKAARNDDDINCLALAADFLDEEVAKEIIDVFLTTEFSKEEKKIRRIAKLSRVDDSS